MQFFCSITVTEYSVCPLGHRYSRTEGIAIALDGDGNSAARGVKGTRDAVKGCGHLRDDFDAVPARFCAVDTEESLIEQTRGCT